MSEHRSIANELITRGWTQGDYSDDHGRVCLLGAVSCLVGEEPVKHTTSTGRSHWKAEGWLHEGADVTDVLARVIGVQSADDIPTWNDEPGRTFDEVLRAAKTADEIFDAT